MRHGAAWAAMGSALWLGCGAPSAVPEPPPEAVLTLLHTSDIHSRLWPFRSRISSFEAEHGLGRAGALGEVGGVTRLATLLARERARAPALWVDSGDALEGAPIFQRFGGRVELELLGSLGLSAMALGNHELSLEPSVLARRLAESARFPVLAANLPPGAASPLEGLLAPSAVLDVTGLRVGVVGVANPQSPPGVGERPSNAWGLAPVADAAGAVQLAIDDLAGRAALVVVLSHLGLDGDRALVRGTSGIAAVLGGHQHLLTAELEWEDDCSQLDVVEARGCSPRRVPIVHSGAYAQWLSRLELRLVAELAQPARLTVVEAALTALPAGEAVPEHPQTLTRLAELRPPPEPPIAFAPSVLARRSPLGGDSALGDLAADAALWRSKADVAVLNSSGLRDDLEAGVLLRDDLELAFPFAEPWRLVSLRGRELGEALARAARRSAARDCESTLQVAGLRLSVQCSACRAGAEPCLRAERETPLGRKPLLDDERLLVVLPDYLARPGADFELAASAGALIELSVPEAIAELLSSRPPTREPAPCIGSLRAWSLSRCAQAFGALACPLEAERAAHECAKLPQVEETRDGRIQMWP